MKRITLDFKNGKKVIESQSAFELIDKLEQNSPELYNYGTHDVDDDIMEILENFKDNQNETYLNNSRFIDALVSLNNAVNECLEAGFSYVNSLLTVRTEIISDLLSDEETATAVLEQNKIDNVKYEEVEDEED